MKISLLFGFLCLCITNTKAQTADDIINKWTDAMGGKEKLASINTLYTENEVSIMNNPALGRTFTSKGKGYKSEIDFSGQKVIDCYTSTGGWSVNPLAGQPTPVNMPAAQVKIGQLQLDPAGPLFNYSAKGSKVELQGKENMNGTSVYKIKLESAAGSEMLFYISDSSFYILKNILKVNAGGQDIDIESLFSNFNKTADGFIIPFKTEMKFPGLSLVFVNKKVEINTNMDATIFDMPKN
jgi:hypothetical protein